MTRELTRRSGQLSVIEREVVNRKLSDDCPGKTNRWIRKRSDQRFDTLDPDKHCQDGEAKTATITAPIFLPYLGILVPLLTICAVLSRALADHVLLVS